MHSAFARAVGSIAAAVVIASLASCGTAESSEAPPEGTAEPGDSTTPMPTATPFPDESETPAEDPSEAPTDEPAEAPNDPSAWVITVDSIGPVELGMSLADVAAMFGTEVSEDERPSSECEYVNGGQSADSDPVLTASGEDGLVHSISVTSVDSGTLDTVGDISSEADLADLLGDPTYPEWGPGGSPAWGVESDGSAALAVGSRSSDDDPIRFHVTDFSYPSDDDGMTWFPVCHD